MNIAEVRKKYPQYSDLSDEQLAKALHGKFYADMPYVDFAAKVGIAQDPKANLSGKLAGTDIPISPSLEAGIIAAGKGATRFMQGTQDLMYGMSDIARRPQRSVFAQQQAAPSDDKRAALAEQVKQENKLHAPLEEQFPASSFAGSLVPYFAIPGGPLMMAAVAGLEYGTPAERAKNMALTFLGAKTGDALGRVIGGPRSAGKGANKWDIPLSTGQQTGNKQAQIIESVLENVPGGGAVRKARDRTTEAFWRSVSREFGEDTSKLTPELLGRARTKIGEEIGRIASRNNIAVDADLFKGLQAAAARAQSELTEDEAKIVVGQIQRIWRQMDPTTGAIPGTLYKATQSKLGELAKNRGGTVASVLGDVRTSLREAMTRSVSPEDSAHWLKANEHYFNLIQVAEATKRTPGMLSPAGLLTQVNQAQKSAKFGGGNDLAELAQFAQKHIGEKIPNSGTAQRQFWQAILAGDKSLGGLLGMGSAALAAPISMAAGRSLAAPPVSPLTRKLLESSGAGLFATQF